MSWTIREIPIPPEACGFCHEVITHLEVTVEVGDDGTETELDWPRCPNCQGC